VILQSAGTKPAWLAKANFDQLDHTPATPGTWRLSMLRCREKSCAETRACARFAMSTVIINRELIVSAAILRAFDLAQSLTIHFE